MAGGVCAARNSARRARPPSSLVRATGDIQLPVFFVLCIGGSTATIRSILINSCYCNLRTQIPKPPPAIFLTHANTVWDTRRRPPGARARNKSGTPAPLARHATSSSGRTGSRRLAAARMRGGLTCTSSTGSAFWPSCRTSWTSPTSRSTSLSTCRSSVRARAPPRWCRAGPPWSPPARS